MDYLEFSRVFTLVASVAITIGFYVQVIKIFVTKSAEDFSLVLLIALLLNEIAWLNYGFALTEWPIIVVGLANFPALIIALVGFFKYGFSKNNKLKI